MKKADGFYAPSEQAKIAFERLLELVAEAGATLVEGVELETEFAIGKIMRYEFKACMNYYLSTLGCGSPIKTLKDIVEYNQANAYVALKYGQTILLDAQNNTSGALTEPEYLEALASRDRTADALDKIFDDNAIDVLLCDAFSNVAPFAGFPSMTIPTGLREDSLPADSYWIARRYGEAALIKIAGAAERRLGLNLRPDLDAAPRKDAI